MPKQSAKTPSIAERLHAHLSGEGIYNDMETDALYREAHGIDEFEETDGDHVATWAVQTAQSFEMARNNAGRATWNRECDKINKEINRR